MYVLCVYQMFTNKQIKAMVLITYDWIEINTEILSMKMTVQVQTSSTTTACTGQGKYRPHNEFQLHQSILNAIHLREGGPKIHPCPLHKTGSGKPPFNLYL